MGCHGADQRGYAVCAACRRDAPVELTPWANPQTEYGPGALARSAKEALRHPFAFFGRVRPSAEGWFAAAAFGAICMGIGLTFSHIWKVTLLGDPADFAELAAQVGVSVETFRRLLFLSIPFTVVLGFVFQTGLFHAAIRLGGGKLPLGATAKIVGYSGAAYLLMAIPPIGEFALGHFLTIVWLFHLRANALQRWENMGTWRSMLVVAVPLLLGMGFTTY